MLTFNVTYETFTEESVENGEAETRGFMVEDVCLRIALDYLGQGDFCEASEYPVTCPRWLTMYQVIDNENHSLHFPSNMTASSRLRVARMLGCYGVS